MLSQIDIKYFKLAVGNNIKHQTDSDITVRCPVCGDSRISRNKARLHLYNKNNKTFVNCFNSGCPVNNRTMYTFLRDFYPSLFSKYREENQSQNLSNLTSAGKLGLGFNTSEDAFANITILNNSSTQNRINLNLFEFDLNQHLIPLDQSESGLNYIKSRGIEYTKIKSKFGPWYIGKSNLVLNKKFHHTQGALIIPLYTQNKKFFGFYSRSLKEHSFSTFIPEQSTGYKIWNLFNIDITKPVYIFEGIFDALSCIQSGFDNCIACLGATPSKDILDRLKEPVFCLDNDITGMRNAIKYAKMGYKCLVYPETIKQKDLNEMLLSNVNIKDLITNNVFSSVSVQMKLSNRI